MPYTKRGRTLAALRALVKRRFLMRLKRLKARERNVVMDVIDKIIERKLFEVESHRYLSRKKYRGMAFDAFGIDANSRVPRNVASQPHLNSAEFRIKYRMTRENFKKLLQLIKNHPVFRTENAPGRGRTQAPVERQLMCLLAFLGRSGGSGSTTRSMFSTGYGTHYLFNDRVVEAICSLRKSVVCWPDEEERKEIADRMLRKYGFPHCVGMGDGTLFPLAFAPSTADAPDYSGRKHRYSLTCFIINDDHRRIRSYMVGWPGSVHDNRVFGSMQVNLKPDEHFSRAQYLLSDSALENCNYVVSAYRKPPLQPMPLEHLRFNTKLAVARIIAEHTIGMLKGRFQWLRDVRMRISNDIKIMTRILRYIDCCVILHNLLLPTDGCAADDSWLEDEVFSDIDDDSRAPTTFDRLNRPVLIGSANDERRTRLRNYFKYRKYT